MITVNAQVETLCSSIDRPVPNGDVGTELQKRSVCETGFESFRFNGRVLVMLWMESFLYRRFAVMFVVIIVFYSVQPCTSYYVAWGKSPDLRSAMTEIQRYR